MRRVLIAAATTVAAGLTTAVALVPASAAAAPTVVDSYATSLTSGTLHGTSTLRQFSTGTATYWLGWASAKGLQPSSTYKHVVTVTGTDGFDAQFDACTFRTTSKGRGSCSGRVAVPSGARNLRAQIFSVGIRYDHQQV
jgi:hypothetical protein